jgi:hypothetical protein
MTVLAARAIAVRCVQRPNDCTPTTAGAIGAGRDNGTTSDQTTAILPAEAASQKTSESLTPGQARTPPTTAA